MPPWLPYLLSPFTLLSPFWPYATAYIPEKSSHSGNSRSFMCCSYMSPSLSWCRRMTHFTKDLLAKDENPESIVLMLKAKWPQMTDLVEVKWVEFCACKGQSEELIVEAEEMENTAKLSYDHCKKYKQQEADEIIENWSWWHSELKGGSRVVHHRWGLCRARLSSTVLLLSVLPFSVSLTAFPSTYVADTIPKSGIRTYLRLRIFLMKHTLDIVFR